MAHECWLDSWGFLGVVWSIDLKCCPMRLILKRQVSFACLGGAFVGVACFGGFLWHKEYSFKQEQLANRERSASLTHEYREASDLVHAEKFAEAVPRLEGYVQQAQHVNAVGKGETVGLSKNQLAECWYYTGAREKGVYALQDVLSAPSSSPRVRADALIKLAEWFREDMDATFASEVVFESGALRDILKKHGGELSSSFLYQEATRLNPDEAVGYYGMAILAADELFSQTELSELDRERLAEEVVHNMEKGDARRAQRRSGIEKISADAEILALRAGIAARMDGFSPFRNSDEEIGASFREALEGYVGQGKNPLRLQYEYLVWLLSSEEAPSEVTKLVFEDFMQNMHTNSGPKREAFFRFLGNIRSDPRQYSYQGALHIAGYDGRFTEFLREAGWSDETLAQGRSLRSDQMAPGDR